MRRLAETLLEKTTYQGFPVVKSRKNLTILGDIARRDLKLAIGAYPTLLCTLPRC